MSEYVTLRDHDGDDGEDNGHQQQDWKSNVTTFGKKMGEQMTAVGGKLTEGVSSVGEKMKDLFHTPTLGERLVDEATSDVLIGPDWEKNLQICDLVNGGKIPGSDVVKGVKRRLVVKSGHVQLLALGLLETALKNCAKLFADVANEKVLDAMVKMVDEPGTPLALKEKILKLIESWGESTEELRYLPVFEETYKSLKSRGVEFPPRDPESLAPIFTPAQSVPAAPRPVPEDITYENARGVALPGVSRVDTAQGLVVVLDSKEILSVARNSTDLLSTVLSSAPPEEAVKDELTMNLAAQCRASRLSVQRLVENESANETLLFEALTVNDELSKVLTKLSEMEKAVREAARLEHTGAALPPPLYPAGAAPAPALAPGIAMVSAAVDADPEADGGDTLVRKRVDVGDVSQGHAEGVPGVPGSGTHRAEDEDARALAELDAMVFGKAPGGASAAPAAASGGTQTSAAREGVPAQSQADKDKGDDLIVF